MTARTTAVRWPSASRQLMVLAGLCGFAISQPLLSVVGDEPGVLVHHGIEGPSLVAFAAVVAFGPPLLLWALTRSLALATERGSRSVYLLTVGALAALFSIQVAKQIGLIRPVGLTLIAVAAGIGFVLAYVRIGFVGTWASYTAILPVLAVASFALIAPASALMHTRATPPQRIAGRADLPSVVMIVLDELPTRSLLDETGGIDRVRYPNLAGLSDDATWYRHNTTLASYTSVAVPSLLTGRIPVVQDALFTNYPDNLFTLLAPTHELEVFETATRLCPYSTCEPTGAAPTTSTPGLGDLLSLTADVWRERVSLGAPAPPALDDFVERDISPPAPLSLSAGASSPEASGLVSDERRLAEPEAQLHVSSARVETFTSSFDRSKGPALYYLHLMLPHQPWLRRADGEPYDVDDPFGLDLPADDWGYQFSWNPWTAAVTEQRHLLQAQYADQQVGEILDALREEGLYEDSIVIVTSDHGISFEERTEARLVEASTLDAIAYTPLFLKMPDQREGVADNSNIEAIDLVPTLADRLGIPLPWAADGVPAGSAGIGARGDAKVLYDLEGVYELHIGGTLEFSDRDTFATVGDRWIGSLTEGDDDLAGLGRRLDLDGILGHAFGEPPGGRRGTAHIGAIDQLREPAPGRTRLGVVSGQVQGIPADGTFVLAVNGRVVAGSELSVDSAGRGGLFTVLLPEGTLGDENEIRAGLVTDEGMVELAVTG